MPYKSERIPIAGTKFDQRRKLSDEQKEAIRILADKGYSQRKLADMFGVSKGVIQYLIHPEQKCKTQQKKRPTAYWTEAKRKHRQRKQALYTSGKLNPRKRRKRNTEE